MKKASGMRHRVSVVAVLFTVACCLLPDARAESPVRQITVTGQAERNFTPDKADVIVVVEGRAKTLKEAKAAHDQLLKALHAVTAKFDIAKSEVKTLSDSINPQYDYINENGNGRQVLRGYTAEHRLQVTLDTLDKMGDFINALVAKNIDRIEQVSYGLQDSDEAEMEVSIMAVKDARAKAEKLLNALDASLGKVLTVNADSGGYMPRPPMPMMMAKGAMAMENASDMATPIPSGDVTVQRTVTVQFEIQ